MQSHRILEERITQYYSSISVLGKLVIAEKNTKGEAMHLAPLGYKNARYERGRSVLVPDLATYELLQQARRLRSQRASIRAVCREMELSGLRSQRGKVIGSSSVLQILAEVRVSNQATEQ